MSVSQDKHVLWSLWFLKMLECFEQGKELEYANYRRLLHRAGVKVFLGEDLDPPTGTGLKLLSASALAKEWGLDYKTVLRMYHKGLIPGIQTGQTAIFFDAESVRAAILGHNRLATQPVDEKAMTAE